MVNGIASAVTDNIAITSISDGTIVPIISITDGVTGISSDGIGISTTASNNALTISNSSASTGLYAQNEWIESDTAAAMLVNMSISDTDSMDVYFGYSSSDLNAGIYSAIPNTTYANNYSLYASGNVNIENLSFMDETSDQNLHLNTFHYEGGVFGYIPQTDIVNSINWNNGNIAHITVGQAIDFYHLQHQQIHLD